MSNEIEEQLQPSIFEDTSFLLSQIESRAVLCVPPGPRANEQKKTTKLGKQKNPGKTGRNNKKETLPDRISLSADEMDRCRSRLRFVCAFFFVVFNPFRVFLRFFSLSLSVVVFFLPALWESSEDGPSSLKAAEAAAATPTPTPTATTTTTTTTTATATATTTATRDGDESDAARGHPTRPFKLLPGAAVVVVAGCCCCCCWCCCGCYLQRPGVCETPRRADLSISLFLALSLSLSLSLSSPRRSSARKKNSPKISHGTK